MPTRPIAKVRLESIARGEVVLGDVPAAIRPGRRVVRYAQEYAQTQATRSDSRQPQTRKINGLRPHATGRGGVLWT